MASPDPRSPAPAASSATAPSEAGDPTDTPFARLALDPWMPPEAITEAMRELAEDAEPEERRRLQGLWRELTLHPEERLDLAFFSHAHPASSSSRTSASAEALSALLGAAPHNVPLPTSLREHRPGVADLVLLPPLRMQLRGPARPGASSEPAWPDVAASDDPLLRL